MILQALQGYYDRKAADPESGIAPEGFEKKEIPFIILIDSQGKFVRIDCTEMQIGKYLRAKPFQVPKGEKRTVGIKACLLWDNAEYALGLCIKGKPERAAEQHKAFVERIELLGVHDEGVDALLAFLRNQPLKILENAEYFDEIKERNPFISFALVEDEGLLICERPSVVDRVIAAESVGEPGTCLVTGSFGTLAKLQPAIKGVRDANTTGGNLVSFNLDAFNSYGKAQGANAPISEKVAFAYTTALNHLLDRDSKQKIQVGDATTVFWSEQATRFEEQFKLCNEESKDDPDAFTRAVKELYESVSHGKISGLESEVRFFVLGLAPNSARLSVRFWQVGTVGEFSERLVQHFRDLEICHAPHERDHLSIWWLLVNLAALGRSENIPPNQAGDWMRSILDGRPYPAAILQSAMRRIKSEQGVSYPRAAIVKACLNRQVRANHFKEKELNVGLDKENTNIGYRLGRLFAALERIQEQAMPNVNATIRDRYYGAASASPGSVLPTLMKMKNHHMSKLDKWHKFFEGLLGEILWGMDEFPSHLNLQDQGYFAIGYYHQRQDFFKKKETIQVEAGE